MYELPTSWKTKRTHPDRKVCLTIQSPSGVGSELVP